MQKSRHTNTEKQQKKPSDKKRAYNLSKQRMKIDKKRQNILPSQSASFIETP